MNHVEANCIPCRLPVPDADLTGFLSQQEQRSSHRPEKERKNRIQFFHLIARLRGAFYHITLGHKRRKLQS